MADLKETAEKKLKSRIRKIKKANKDDGEKEKFFNDVGCSLEIEFYNKKKDVADGVILYTYPDGKIFEGEYFYSEGEAEMPESVVLKGKDLDAVIEVLSDFKLQLSGEE